MNKKVDVTKLSLMDKVKLLSKKEQKSFIDGLSQDEAYSLIFDFEFNATPKQLLTISEEAKKKFIVCMDMGRGGGKTWTGAQWTKTKALSKKCYVNIIGPTIKEVEKNQIYGPSGIMAVCSELEKPFYNSSKGLLIWPNGSISNILSAENPEAIRGKSANDCWADEVCAWFYLQEAWEQLLYTVREDEQGQILVTTTPKRDEFYINKIRNSKHTYLIKGTTFDNNKLSKRFLENIKDLFDGTKLGRQELYAEILDIDDAALFDENNVNSNRVENIDNITLTQIVVAIDPATTSNSTSDMTGIVVCGKGEDGHYYILEDATMLAKPNDWAMKAIELYHKYKANYIIAETNNGGDMVESLLRNIDYNIAFEKVTATRGKMIRAEPIAGIYQKNLVHHVGIFDKLEKQMYTFIGSVIGKKSPDRVDALVWGLTYLSDINGMGLYDLYKDIYKKEFAKK